MLGTGLARMRRREVVVVLSLMGSKSSGVTDLVALRSMNDKIQEVFGQKDTLFHLCPSVLSLCPSPARHHGHHAGGTALHL